ncbi:MAG: hypothetical protein E6H56_16605 [Betaproteobacteria bacterium]|nr:MAG: hypothetical protein E6H56_16605 [Betaproteobacteria bacterium]
MDHRALAALIIRVAGLLVIVSAITYATKSFGPFFVADTVQKVGVELLLASAFVSVVIPIALGLVLVYFPGMITTRVLRIEGLESGSESDTKALQRVAFTTIGLWLTLYAVIDAVYFYSRARLYFRFFQDMPAYSKLPPLSPDDFGGLLASGLQLIIGLWLLIGNRAIVNVLTRLRG